MTPSVTSLVRMLDLVFSRMTKTGSLLTYLVRAWRAFSFACLTESLWAYSRFVTCVGKGIKNILMSPESSQNKKAASLTHIGYFLGCSSLLECVGSLLLLSLFLD